MSKRGVNLTPRYAALISILGTLSILAAIAYTVAMVFWHDSLRKEQIDQVYAELMLVDYAVEEQLLKNHFNDARDLLEGWVAEHKIIYRIDAVAPNGFTIMSSQKPGTPEALYTIDHDIVYSQRTLLTIKLTLDLNNVEARLGELQRKLLIVFPLAILVLGMFLWGVVRKSAIIPLEKAQSELKSQQAKLASTVEERTKDLQSEIKTRRTVERDLRISREHYRRLIDGLREHFVYSHGTDGVFSYVSPSVEHILGYTPEDFLKHFSTYLTPSPINDAVGKRTALTLQGHQQSPYQVEIFDSMGETRLLEVVESPVRNAEGAIIAVEGVAQDITLRRHMEEELRNALVDAERANEAKSEFLASMSHELRTPLNAVLGFSQLLQMDSSHPLSNHQLEHVQSILSGGQHLLELVNQVLDLSRIEANQAPLFLEDVDASDLVSECIALSLPLAEKKDVTIHNTLNNVKDVIIRTDRLRMKQVVLNLLSNAIKYNRDGGTVTISDETDDSNFWRLSIQDTGMGIAKEDQDHVFQMFHRLGEDPTISREGTGIGLTVCQLLVERMAGRIGFESEPGRGSTFWIELPLKQNDQIVIWADALRINVDVIDDDHQRIVAMMNKLSQNNLSPEDVDRTVSELVDHTLHHFRREEAVMEACGYPDFERHRELHSNLADRVKNLERQWCEHRDPNFALELQGFLRELWVDHVTQEDCHISQYARGREKDILKALADVKGAT